MTQGNGPVIPDGQHIETETIRAGITEGSIPKEALEPSVRVQVDPEYAERIARLIDWNKAKAVWGALVAALIAGGLVLWTALDNDVVTAQEWVQVALAVLGAPTAVGSVVYRTKNKPKQEKG